MKNLFWRFIAWLVTRPRIREHLIRRAQRTPYMHIWSPDGTDIYMFRWWLFNPYDRTTQAARWPWIPFSIRIHHIMRADYDDHCHDHPWNARTIILKGWYVEKRLATGLVREAIIQACCTPAELVQHRVTPDQIQATQHFRRHPGDTAALRHGEYHQITEVGDKGAVTLFITGRYQGMWGFLRDGAKVPWKKYLGLAEDQDLPDMAAPAQEKRSSLDELL